MPSFGSVQKTGLYSWKLTVSGGFDGGGKRIRHTRTIRVTSDNPEKQKKEADQQLGIFIAEIEKGQCSTAKKLVFKEFIEIWLRDYAEKQLAPKTLFRYRQLLDSRIIPALGKLKLETIKPNHLLSFYSNLAEPGIRKDKRKNDPDSETEIQLEGLSERTILHHHRLIHTILATAVQWQYIVNNPASRVKAPKVPKKPAAVYDQEQTTALLAAVQSEPFKYQVITLLAIATGMRQGEIMGLTWKHVNYDSNFIQVQQAAQYLPGKGRFLKDPKNETSKRTISVPSTVMDILKQYKKHQAEERLQLGDKWKASDMLFTSWDGQPMYPNEMSTWFPKFLKRHNLQPLPFHGLRHTSATLLIAEGLTATDLSRRLGHSTTSTTMNIYAHSLQKADEVAAQKMGNILSGSNKKAQKDQAN